MITGFLTAFSTAVTTIKENKLISALVLIICFATYNSTITKKNSEISAEKIDYIFNEQKQNDAMMRISSDIGVRLERLRAILDADRAGVRLFIYTGKDDSDEPKYVVTKYVALKDGIYLPQKALNPYESSDMKKLIAEMWYSSSLEPKCITKHTNDAKDSYYQAYLKQIDVTAFSMCPMTTKDGKKIGFVGVGYVSSNKNVDLHKDDIEDHVMFYTKEIEQILIENDLVFDEHKTKWEFWR